MDSANMPDAIRMLFFLPSALCVRAKWAPMELYTWMLGHRLVGVSACHSIEIIWVKTLSLGITGGRRWWPLGHSVDISRNTVIPVARNAKHLLKFCLSVSNRYTTTALT